MSIGGPGCQTPPVPTPCINVCRLDEATSLCLGCARNSAEIGAWAEADAGFKRAVWEALPARRARLGMSAYRLPWTAGEIASFMESTLREHSGRWTLGACGASVSFVIGACEAVEIASTLDAVTAVTARGALRLVKHEKSIAVAFGNAADSLGPEAIGLVLPRGRVSLRQGVRLDEAAVCEAHRHQTLLPVAEGGDLAARFYLRSPDARATAAPPDVSSALFAGHVQAVVETGLGRAEIFTSDGGEGPTFDLGASRLVEAQELPPPWTLDRVFALGALFYPQLRAGGRR